MKFNQAAFTLLGIGVHYASGNLRSAKVSSLAVSTGDGKSEESSGKGSRSMEEVHFCCTINFQDCYGDPFWYGYESIHWINFGPPNIIFSPLSHPTAT